MKKNSGEMNKFTLEVWMIKIDLNIKDNRFQFHFQFYQKDSYHIVAK